MLCIGGVVCWADCDDCLFYCVFLLWLLVAYLVNSADCGFAAVLVFWICLFCLLVCLLGVVLFAVWGLVLVWFCLLGLVVCVSRFTYGCFVAFVGGLLSLVCCSGIMVYVCVFD